MFVIALHVTLTKDLNLGRSDAKSDVPFPQQILTPIKTVASRIVETFIWSLINLKYIICILNYYSYLFSTQT